MEDVNSSNFQFVEELTELRRSLVRCADDPALLGLDSIVKAVPDLIYRLDADGRILFINDAIERYGYTAQELIGTNIFDLVHPEDREKAIFKINERRSGMRGTQSLELRLLTKNNISIPFEFKSNSSEVDPILIISAEGVYATSSLQDGRFICTQGVGRDITERKWVEEAIRRSHDELEEKVQDRTADLLAAQIQMEREMIERRRAEEALKKALAREEIMGQVRDHIIAMRGIADLPAEQYWIEVLRQLDVDIAGFSLQFPASSAGFFVSYLLDRHCYTAELSLSDFPWVQRTWHTGKPVVASREELITAFWDNKYKCILEIPLPGGGSLGCSSEVETAFGQEDVAVLEQFARVLSEAFRRLEDLKALATKNEQLLQAQKMEAIGQLTAGVAHNFNNMLQGITGNLDLALEETNEAIKPFLDGAYTAARRAASMIQQLMVYSRQGISFRPQLINCNELVDEVVRTCRKTFDRKIKIDVQALDQSPIVKGNRGQLEQALLNLCLNARDAVEEAALEQPFIKIELGVVEVGSEGIIEAGIASGRFVRIVVADNGLGMDEDTQRRVFEPFFTTKEVGKGTGLGLSTVFGIIQDHGGWVVCHSQLNQGSVFTFHLPVSSENIAALPPV